MVVVRTLRHFHLFELPLLHLVLEVRPVVLLKVLASNVVHNGPVLVRAVVPLLDGSVLVAGLAGSSVHLL